jgi:hypothetical protein
MIFINLSRLFAGAMAVALACGFLPSASQAADAPDSIRKLEDMVLAFDEMAVKVNGSRATELARWTGPIYLSIADTPGMERVSAEAEALVRNLAQLAQVPVHRVAANDRRRNFSIVASSRDGTGSTPCVSQVDWDEAGRLTFVEVRLNLNNYGRLSRCANHEIVHGFGLRAHPDSAFSVLSYRYSTQAQLTDTDRVVLAALYDRRVPGTGSMDTTTHVACQVIAEKMQISADAAASVCESRSAPSRGGLFASLKAGGNRPQENIGQ